MRKSSISSEEVDSRQLKVERENHRRKQLLGVLSHCALRRLV
jgi:hypothetical protein